MAKKTSKKSVPNVEEINTSLANSIPFKIGDRVSKINPNSDDYGKVGIIKNKDVSAGSYHFCWVDWGYNFLKPEHYNCIKKVNNGNKMH